MRTQEILTRINEAIALFGDNNLSPACTAMKSIANDLEAQLRNEIATSKGVASATRVIGAILKDAEKNSRRALAYPWIDAEGRQCVCDGFEAFRLRNHLPLPERPDNAGDPIDLDRIFPKSMAGWKALKMPSANDLKSFIAVERTKYAGNKRNFLPIWDFGEHEPSVDARYLLNAATVFPNADEIFWNTLVSPLMITCNDGEAIILPIRNVSKTQVPPATQEERDAINAERKQREDVAEEDRKRHEIIRKAHDEYSEATEIMRAELVAKQKAFVNGEEATNEADRAKAKQEYRAHCVAEAKARIRQHAAKMIFDADEALTPTQFEYIVTNLYPAHDVV